MSSATLTPGHTAERLCELSTEVRAAVLLDAAGALAAFHGVPMGDSRQLAELARQLFESVDRAHRDLPGGPPEQVEVQIDGGLYNRLSITERNVAPLSDMVTTTGDTTSSV